MFLSEIIQYTQSKVTPDNWKISSSNTVQTTFSYFKFDIAEASAQHLLARNDWQLRGCEIQQTSDWETRGSSVLCLYGNISSLSPIIVIRQNRVLIKKKGKTKTVEQKFSTGITWKFCRHISKFMFYVVHKLLPAPFRFLLSGIWRTLTLY